MYRNVILLAAGVAVAAAFATSAVLARQDSGHRQEVIRFFDEVWTKGNLEVIDEMMHPEFARYAPSTQGATIGIPAFKELVQRVRSSFSSYSITLETMTGVDDKATIQWTLRGNYVGPDKKIEPGRSVELAGTSVWIFRGDEIIKEIVDYDDAEYHRQIEMALPYTELENRTVALSVFYELFSQGNLTAAYDLVGSEHILHDPGNPSIIGPDGFADRVREMRRAFPDLNITLHEMVADGSLVSTRWTLVATHGGQWQDIPATGKRISVSGVTFMRVKDGKVQETWSVWDRWGLREVLTR